MTKRMLIDATHHEETRVAVMEGNRLVEFDYESKVRRLIKGNIFLAKVTRVEPSLQAAFVNYGGNRHGFLPFAEIHPDYYRIPVADREALMAEQRALEEREAARAETEEEGGEDESRADLSEQGEDTSEFGDAPHEEEIEEIGGGRTAQGGSDEQSPAAADMVAEEIGYVHEDVDLTLPESSEAFDTENDEGDDLPEVEEESDAEDLDESESGENGEAAEGHDETTEEGRRGRNGRRSWRRGGRNGGGRRYMGARRNRDEISEDSVASLHARFRRRYKIQEVIKRGQIMLVQVSKEERGNKGAAVTTYLSLPGRYCVLMPNSPRGGGVSRKVGNMSDRRRMKEMLGSLEVPSGMSVILRTAGVERSQPEIKRDFDYLVRLWDKIRDLTLKSTAPSMIYEEGDLIKRSIRDIYASDIDDIIVSGADGYTEAREFMNTLMPDHVDRVDLYTEEKLPLFQRYQVENQINEIGEPVVQLKSGGYLVINQTEALVAVDVNSGRATKERHIEETALKTNLEAAEEVARQLRLRDLGGLVVIDFIDMEDRRNNMKVERRLKDALSTDRARIQVSRISTFGLLELSRQRLNPSLTEAQFEKCPHCHGFGYIRSVDSAAIAALRALEEEGVRARTNRVTLHIPNKLALYILNEKREMLATIERRYNFNVSIHVDESLAPSNYTVEAMKMMSADDEADEGDESEDEASENKSRQPRGRRANKPATMDESYHNEAPVAEVVDEETEAVEENFNRADVEPDGAPDNNRGNRGRGNRDRNNKEGRGPRRSPYGNRDRNDRGDRNNQGRNRNRGPRTDQNQPDPSVNVAEESGRAETSARSDAPQDNKPKATYFVAKKRAAAPAGSESVPLAAPAPAMDPAPSNGDGPKKKGWWSKFS